MSAWQCQTHASNQSDRESDPASCESSAAIERYLEDEDPWRKSVAVCKEENKEPSKKASIEPRNSLADMENHMDFHQSMLRVDIFDCLQADDRFPEKHNLHDA